MLLGARQTHYFLGRYSNNAYSVVGIQREEASLYPDEAGNYQLCQKQTLTEKYDEGLSVV